MNKNIMLIFPSLIALTSCKNEPIFPKIYTLEDSEQTINHNYQEIAHLKFDWNDIYSQSKNEYFVYFYSLTCSHCQNLKNLVIEFALKNDNVFFIEANEKVVIENNVDHTIGISSVSELAILGYPSLIKIEQNVCVFNVAGEHDIKSKLNL